MFRTVIPKGSFYDESKNRFIDIPETVLQLEHSLLSISRWESKWNRSFFSNGPKTDAERIDYIKCMTITPNVNPVVYQIMPDDIRRQIEVYCTLPMTATTFGKRPDAPRGRKKVITSEEIYYLMIYYGIPFECEKWHFNRLQTLIEICNIRNTPQKKMSQKDLIAHHRAVNAQRRAQ